jgi:hypothetical protein
MRLRSRATVGAQLCTLVSLEPGFLFELIKTERTAPCFAEIPAALATPCLISHFRGSRAYVACRVLSRLRIVGPCKWLAG